MKRVFLAALLLPALAGCPDAPSSAPDAGADDGPRCLSILAWNDLHGQLVPDSLALDTGRVPLGGVIALADEVERLRQTHDAVVTLDAGDLFTGPMESTVTEGAPIIGAYKALGVDAVTIGNHEFDFGPVGYDRVVAAAGMGDEVGPDGPRGALLARMAEAPFPFLSANLRRQGGAPTGWKNHLPSTLIARAGFKVGVVGYTTAETPTTTFKDNVVGLDFVTGAAEHVGEEIRSLRARGASPIVLLAHASLQGELPQLLDDPADPEGRKHAGEVADLLAGLGDALPDLVVAGHRHAWMLGRVRGVPIVSSDYHGAGIARARFCRQTDGRMKLEGLERRVVFGTTSPATALGASVTAAIAPWIAQVKKDADVVVATLPRACTARSSCGTCLAEQVARAIAEHASEAAPIPKGASLVGFLHIGGLRASLPAGPLTVGDIFRSYPFENSVGVCGTTKKGLAQLLRNALTKDTSSRDRLPFGLVGARVRLRRLETGELELVRVDLGDDGNGPKADDAPVLIALPDFLLAGGDGFTDGITCSPSASSSARVRDAWRTVIEREKGGCEGAARNVVVLAP